MNLASPAAVADLLKRHGIRPKRRWGQNFLTDGNLLAKVVDAAELRPDQGVLEIGPGFGVLTLALADRTRQVLAVEIDPELYGILTAVALVGRCNVTALNQDFLELDLERAVDDVLGPGRHAVVANIPYSVTTPILVRLLEHGRPFERIVLMLQKEVAERLAAAPGASAYGSLTLFVHLYADVRLVSIVPAGAFVPAPEVDSAIICLDLLDGPRFPGIPVERYLAVVHAAFQQRRKTLSNALTGPALGWSREQARAALEAAGIDPVRRGETLTPEEFAHLVKCGPNEPVQIARPEPPPP